jgi:hypothetical protein
MMIYKFLKLLEDYFYAKSNECWETYWHYIDFPESFLYDKARLARDMANLYQAIGDAIPTKEE